MSNDIASRVREVREALGLNQVVFAARVGVSPGTIGNLEAGTRSGSADTLLAIAKAGGVRVEWLRHGVDPKFASADANPRVSVHSTLGGDVLKAHEMSQSPDRFEVPLLTWEQIVSGADLGELFRTLIRDEAMGRDYPRGHEVVWSTVRPPRIGRPVLVRDSHGQLHNRIYAQGRVPGEWIAEAYAPGYRSFASGVERLEVVGVYKGLLEPDD